jgi:hypothetical protein
MSLDSIAAELTQERKSQSPYVRAVTLFEFEVAMLGKSFQQLIEGEDPELDRRSARLFAAIKLLEYLENKMQRENNILESLPLKILASNEDYCRLYDEVIVPAGGWHKIRHLRKAKEFDSTMRARRVEAKAVACIIDFSYRYARLEGEKTYKKQGGVTLARYVVGTSQSYGLTGSRSTIKSRWREYKYGSVFIYLLQKRQYPFLPPKVSFTGFADSLLQQVENIETLRKFFREYQHIVEIIATQRYEFPKLSLDLKCDLSPISIDQFPRDIVTAIRRAAYNG